MLYFLHQLPAMVDIRNDEYGYDMEIAPGWYLGEETAEGDATFWNEDGTGIMEIYAYYMGYDWSLKNTQNRRGITLRNGRAKKSGMSTS